MRSPLIPAYTYKGDPPPPPPVQTMSLVLTIYTLSFPKNQPNNCLVLQTLNSISAEKNSTVIFPLPMDILNHYLNRKAAKAEAASLSGRSPTKCDKSKEE